jgi:hypothetical protein
LAAKRYIQPDACMRVKRDLASVVLGASPIVGIRQL